ncbi:MAG: transcription-repair coupling factor [Bacilli bacterium]
MDDVIGTSLLISASFQKKPENFLVVTTNLYNAQQVYSLLVTLLGEGVVLFFPMDELLRSESLAASKDMLAQQLSVLSALNDKKPHIIVCNLAAALRYLPSPEIFNTHCFNFHLGDTYDISEITRKLIASGYTRVNKIDQTLQFALRGDILDIFSVNAKNPVRIEFFDDEIESIRLFDLATQTSFKEIEEIKIFPATDMILTLEQKEKLIHEVNVQKEKDIIYLPYHLREKLESQISEDMERIINHEYHSRLYKYMGFAMEKSHSLIDYISSVTIVVPNQGQFETHERILQEESIKYLLELQNCGQCISHLQIYQRSNEVFGRAKRVVRFFENRETLDDTQFLVRPIVGQSRKPEEALRMIEYYLTEGRKLIITFESPKQQELFANLFTEERIAYEILTGLNIPKGKIGVTLFNLERGFELPDYNLVILTMRELLGSKTHPSRFVLRFHEATIIKSYDELEPGDYVVHEIYGVGQFTDIKTLFVDGVHRDYLHINYAAGDVLYVPLAQFHLVRKFLGREGLVPKLNRLNTKEWEKTKNRIKSRVKNIAKELVELYSLRSEKPGFAFPEDDELQMMFENEFPYSLTPDQEKALQEIKENMEKPAPMDHLLCGDVGFGKTELAFRAAFKAISTGKQVAILCPTTLLARQHYEVATNRFANFGIRIGHLSRLISDAQQRKEIQAINAGEIDLIIGTHRLLSKEIQYPALGLLIIDEEQRFGVEQKEKIKSLRVNIDVLTLSATPIPRTLQMSLIGIRSISQINTPPEERRPIQTYVMCFHKEVVRELLERELARHGQVFYVHNRVSSILNKAKQIQSLLPLARIGVVHGQMPREQIEDVMLKFYLNDIDILVCTSIIENGIDVPNANLIIIENADRFGLAQLYQIKGRVGRSNRIAYAYLFYSPQKEINQTARKRLKAIQDFTEFGSGYKIAQRDLLIRGAGDILGAEQAGFLETVGIDMYMKLLNEAILEQKTGKPPSQTEPRKTSNMAVDAYIPQEYAPKIDKIALYKRIDSCQDLNKLNQVEKELRDIYGRIPEETKTLLRQQAIEIYLKGEEFTGLKEDNETITLTLSRYFTRIPRIGTGLFEKISDYTENIKVVLSGQELLLQIGKNEDWFDLLEKIIFDIHKLYEKERI